MTQAARRRGQQGWALRRLLDIHDGLRGDLARLRRAVTAVAEDGQDLDAAAAALGQVSFRDPGWTLRRFCAGFCGHVHGHHTTEDRALFPLLLRRGSGDGALAGVIGRLQADHRRLTGQLEEVERALAALPGDADARAAAAGAIARLADQLETHLRVEEERLAPALNALSRAVPEAQFAAPPSRLRASGSPAR